MGGNWFLMKFDFLEFSGSFSGCAPDLTIRLGSRAGAANKTILSNFWTASHVSGFVLAVAEVEVVSALVVSK